MISTTRTRRPRLETVQRRLDRWRARRPYVRAPLPPRLWKAALALVSEHGLYGASGRVSGCSKARASAVTFWRYKSAIPGCRSDGGSSAAASFAFRSSRLPACPRP
jgi:hypothetical protein